MSRKYAVILNLPLKRNLFRRLQVEGITDLREKLRPCNTLSEVSGWEVYIQNEWFDLDEHSWEEAKVQDTQILRPHAGK